MRVSRSIQWGWLNGMRKVETPEQMTEEYRATLLKIVYALASTEFASVEQHQRWINQGPTAEDRFIQAQIAADEAHQGFIDCRLLRHFGNAGAGGADQGPGERRALPGSRPGGPGRRAEDDCQVVSAPARYVRRGRFQVQRAGDCSRHPTLGK